MPSLWHEVLASATAGSAATVIGHPLDCVKVRLQASRQQSTLSSLECALGMLRTDGPSSFWRGITPPLLNSVLMNTLMFVGAC